MRDRRVGPAVRGVRGRRCRPRPSADFDSDLTEEFFRAVASTAKLTVHVTVERGQQHPPHGRGRVQGVRPRAARGGVDRPRRGRASRPRRACCERRRDPRLRHGQPALGREGVRARGGPRGDHPRPRARARRRSASCCPGWARCRRRWSRCGELGLDELLRERRDAGVPIIGICMGMQLLFESTTELGGAEGIGLLEGAVEPLDAPGAEGAAHRLEPGVLAARVASSPRACPTRAPSTTCTRSRPGPQREEDVVGTASYGDGVRERGGAAAGLRRAVPPREVRARRTGACWPTSPQLGARAAA